MLSGDREIFRAGAATSRLLPLLGERSLIVSDGDAHRERRRALLPAFGVRGIEPWRQTVRRIAREHVERWPRGRAFAVLPRTRQLAFDAVAAILGVDVPHVRDRLMRSLDRLGSPPVLQAILMPAWRRHLGGLGPWALLDRRLAGIDALLRAALADRRPPDGLQTVADHLVELRGRGVLSSDEELTEELRTLLLVGHETASAAMAWIVLLAAHHPDCLGRLSDERQRRSLIRESLRLHPPVVDVVRELSVARDLDGHRLPGGTILMAAPTLVHARGDLHAAPEDFRPGRFVDQPARPPAWIAFGGGPRRCLGAALAEMELEALLLAVADAGGVSPVRARMESARLHGTTLVPAHGARVVLGGRRAAHAALAVSAT